MMEFDEKVMGKIAEEEKVNHSLMDSNKDNKDEDDVKVWLGIVRVQPPWAMGSAAPL